MGHTFSEGIVTVITLIIGVASLSVILSPKARTSQVIQATASGVSNMLGTAMTPVTGNPMKIVTSYPSSGNSFDGSFSMPQMGLGMPTFS